MKLIEMIIPKALAQAQGTTASSNLTLGDFNILRITEVGFDGLFGRIIGLVLLVAALVAFFYLIFSGFQYITSGGDPAKAQTARQGIVNALIGVIIIMLSYTILRYVSGLI